jgi:predicted NodU family carbamoyl transferase
MNSSNKAMVKLISRFTESRNGNVNLTTYSNRHTEPIVKEELYTIKIKKK